jgi:peptidoglycan/LPS O-acetylase OafA/YrhL
VGRRSRKRAQGAAPTRAERDAARRERPKGRRSTEERPPAPWGGFPLVELLVLAGIVVMIWGVVSWDEEGNKRFAAGLLLAALGGLELSVREHFAGYRSHTTLLAGVAAFAVVSVLILASGPHEYWVLLLVAVAVFGGCFYALRRAFQHRSGGLSFR